MTWNTAPATKKVKPEHLKGPAKPLGIPQICSYCHQTFASKNVLFRHLRFGPKDDDSDCARKVAAQGGIQFGGRHAPSRGDAIKALVSDVVVVTDCGDRDAGTASSTEGTGVAAALGGGSEEIGGSSSSSSFLSSTCCTSDVPDVLDAVRSHQAEQPPQELAEKDQGIIFRNRRTGSKNKPSKTAQNKAELHRSAGFSTKPEQELWMGAIPQQYASIRAIRQLIWENLKTPEEKAWTIHVKKLVKKGYRKSAKEPWMAFAILAFKTRIEAERVLEVLNGRVLVRKEDRRAEEADVGDLDHVSREHDREDFLFFLRKRETKTSNPARKQAVVDQDDASTQKTISCTGINGDGGRGSRGAGGPASAATSSPGDQVQQEDDQDQDNSSSTSPRLPSLGVCEMPPLFNRLMALPLEQLVERWQVLSEIGEDEKDSTSTTNSSFAALISSLKSELRSSLESTRRGDNVNISKSNSKGPIARALAKVQEFCEAAKAIEVVPPNATTTAPSPSFGTKPIPNLFNQASLTGRSIPEPLCAKLHEELKALQWPIQKHRQRLKSDHYAVVWRNRPRQEFESIYPLFEELMEWAGKNGAGKNSTGIPWTHIAVTKNFVGSPHIDEFDQTFQFCASFGEFQTGGELCVEDCDLGHIHKRREMKHITSGEEESLDSLARTSTTATTSTSTGSSPARDQGALHPDVDPAVAGEPEDPRLVPFSSTLYVCTTKNRLVKVDGRYVHFVRGYDQKNFDRYSLVFYCLDEKGFTPKKGAVDWEWMVGECR
ncbi:unnamed protein product [Amoebophrya sp. A25]|nr:unnamed protein product [Amoebophrya sp. A25]|eukprot:GSA25T00021182001.1